MNKNSLNLLTAWYAFTHAKRGPLNSKDRAVLKWLAGILGIVFLGGLISLAAWNI